MPNRDGEFVIKARPWQRVRRNEDREASGLVESGGGGIFLPLDGGVMAGDILVDVSNTLNMAAIGTYFANMYSKSMFTDALDDLGGGSIVFSTVIHPSADDGARVGSAGQAWGEIHGYDFVVYDHMRTTNNLGTLNTGVTIAGGGTGERGDGHRHLSILNTVKTDALTMADNAPLGIGYLLYTFPAGIIIVDGIWINMGIVAASSEIQSDTPEVGIGTVIASGAVSVLSGTSTFENLLTGQVAANCNGTLTVKTATPTAGTPFVIESGDAHTLYFNVAHSWANDTGGDLTANITGNIAIDWRFIL